jgi:hypothetical protein
LTGGATAAASPGAPLAGAAPDASQLGLGYAEASAILGPAGGTFMGQHVDGSAVLVRYTLLGDANLDGGVDFLDLVRLAQNYNQPTSGLWAGGDFNDDGIVDFSDLVNLARNYNTTYGGATGIPGAPAGFDAEFAAAIASVPEPGSALACAGFAAAAASCRGRRRRRPPPDVGPADVAKSPVVDRPEGGRHA